MKKHIIHICLYNLQTFLNFDYKYLSLRPKKRSSRLTVRQKYFTLWQRIMFSLNFSPYYRHVYLLENRSELYRLFGFLSNLKDLETNEIH